MLTKEQILENQKTFLELIESIERPGAELERLKNKLLSSDFFYAPASTKYHCDYPGGLCEHSLNVYYNLVALVNGRDGLDASCYDENSLKIVALLHDISKMNIYEQTFKNEKVYSEDGSKRDNGGKFDWVSVSGWRLKDNRFIYGNHEATSDFIISQFIPMTIDERVAVLHHMGGKSWDSAQDDLTRVYGSYSLAVLLHLADMLATYIDERRV